ncbi:MAG: SpoIIE family protein phosphatase, partial [Bacillota bacterium]
MQVLLGVAKAPKHGVLESGDTFEVVERRRGGFSVIVADGQGSGAPAKRLSNLVVSRAMSLISEGARDGAVARAVHDVLYALRDGKVSCELAILSVDLRTRTLVISRNTAVPVWVRTTEGLVVCSDESSPIGM